MADVRKFLRVRADVAPMYDAVNTQGEDEGTEVGYSTSDSMDDFIVPDSQVEEGGESDMGEMEERVEVSDTARTEKELDSEEVSDPSVKTRRFRRGRKVTPFPSLSPRSTREGAMVRKDYRTRDMRQRSSGRTSSKGDGDEVEFMVKGRPAKLMIKMLGEMLNSVGQQVQALQRVVDEFDVSEWHELETETTVR
jgi:hypothetical protein